MTQTVVTRDFASNIHIETKDFTHNTVHKATTKILPPGRTYICMVDYPFSHGFTFKIKTGDAGITLKGFVTRLANAYKKHYAKIDGDEIEDGYWHGFGDLYLEKTLINDDTLTIDVWIGS